MIIKIIVNVKFLIYLLIFYLFLFLLCNNLYLNVFNKSFISKLFYFFNLNIRKVFRFIFIKNFFYLMIFFVFIEYFSYILEILNIIRLILISIILWSLTYSLFISINWKFINLLEERNFLFRFFTILLELVRNLIRPFTLAFRLSVNLFFGLIIKILLSYIEFVSYRLISSFFEIFIFFIQIYIFFTLLLEYIRE